MLNGNDEIVGNPRRLPGYILNESEVKLSGSTMLTDNGNLNFKDKLLEVPTLKDWVMVYSYGKNAEYDDTDADSAVTLMQKASQAFGVTIKTPGFITIQGNKVEVWKEQIENDVQKNGKPQIVVLFFTQFEEKLYGPLKEFLTCQLSIPCQVIRRRTLSSQQAKNPMSAATKIVIQINQKIGGIAWEVIKKH